MTQRHRFLITFILLSVIAAAAVMFVGPRFLRGDLLDDAIAFNIKEMADTNHDGILTAREIRSALVKVIRGVALQDAAFDIDNNSGTVNRSDVAAAVRAFRALLAAVCGNGAIEAGERCDDGNDNGGVGCSIICTEEFPVKTFVQAHEMPWTGKTVQVRDDLVAFQADGTYESIDGGRSSERIAPYPYDYFGDPYIDPVIARHNDTSYIVTGYIAMCLIGSTRHQCAQGEIPTSTRQGSVSQWWSGGWTGQFTPPIPNVFANMDSIGDFRGTRWRIRGGVERWRGTLAQNDPWGRQPAWEAVGGIFFDRPLASLATMGTSLVAISVDGTRLYEQTEDLTWHTYEVEGITGEVRALLSERDSLLVVAGSEGERDHAYILPDSHTPIALPAPPEQRCGDGVYDITWKVSDVRTSFGSTCSSIAYGNGFFQTVGRYTLMSFDGITWGFYGGTPLSSITYGNGLFVGVAPYKVMTAVDSQWIERSDPDYPWTSVTYGNDLSGNSLFVAVASSGLKPVMTSPNGIIWTARNAPLPGSSTDVHRWESVTYGNDPSGTGLFVAVSSVGIDRVMTSPDGIIWTAHSAASQSAWNQVIYGNGLFIATDGGKLMSSVDGVAWIERAFSTTAISMTYENGLFVEVTPTLKRTSPNGITWTNRASNGIYRMTYGNGLFVAMTRFSVLTSPDGITWTASVNDDENNVWTCITYGNNLFVAAGGSDDMSRVMISDPDHEQCDDGNLDDTDGCTNECTLQMN